jgi:hypothetical protein
MVSLRERLQKLYTRQHLQRRIDLLVESSTHPYGRMRVDSYEEAKIEAFLTSEEVDANPIGSVSGDCGSLSSGTPLANFARHRDR